MKLLYVDSANKRDLTIMKEGDDFTSKLKGCTILLDKAYIDKGFTEEMENRGVN